MRIPGAVVLFPLLGGGLLLTGCGDAARTAVASLASPVPSGASPIGPSPIGPSPTGANPSGASPTGPASGVPTAGSTPTARSADPNPTTAPPVSPPAASTGGPSTGGPSTAAPILPSPARSGGLPTHAPSAPAASASPRTASPGCPRIPAPLWMTDDVFAPATLTVGVGTAITLTNCGGKFHSWTSPAAGFDSGPMATRAIFTFAFTTPGTFSFLCSYHPGMTGSVTVR